MRITWFGGRCFRIKFSENDFVFYPKEERADFNAAALAGDTIVVENASHEMFTPLIASPETSNSGRLIDVMDDPERFLSGEGQFVLDAPPDERLVIKDLSAAMRDEVGTWQNGAVFLGVGSFEQCLAQLNDGSLNTARQLIFAVVDPQALDMDRLAAAAGKMRIQLAEIGLAIEL